jgi:hypothetical protein
MEIEERKMEKQEALFDSYSKFLLRRRFLCLKEETAAL